MSTQISDLPVQTVKLDDPESVALFSSDGKAYYDLVALSHHVKTLLDEEAKHLDLEKPFEKGVLQGAKEILGVIQFLAKTLDDEAIRRKTEEPKEEPQLGMYL